MKIVVPELVETTATILLSFALVTVVAQQLRYGPLIGSLFISLWLWLFRASLALDLRSLSGAALGAMMAVGVVSELVALSVYSSQKHQFYFFIYSMVVLYFATMKFKDPVDWIIGLWIVCIAYIGYWFGALISTKIDINDFYHSYSVVMAAGLEFSVSRPSGIGRFALIGMLSSAFIFYNFRTCSSRSMRVFKIVSILSLFGCLMTLVVSQSRSNFGILLVWIMFYGVAFSLAKFSQFGQMDQNLRRNFWTVFASVVSALFAVTVVLYFSLHELRGLQSWNALSGRGDIWYDGWRLFLINPFGYGTQADRFLVGISASNGLIYWMMSSGILGIIGYAFVLACSAIFIFKLLLGSVVGNEFSCAFGSGLLILFVVRSGVESSFTVIGLDMVVFCLAMRFCGASRDQGDKNSC